MATQAACPAADSVQSGSFALLDQVAMPVFVVENTAKRKAVYVAFNRHARDISGLALDDVLGRTAKEVYGGRYGQAAFDRHCVALDSGCPMRYELTLPIAGVNRQIRTSLEPVLDTEGRALRVVGTSLDISAAENLRNMHAHATTLQSEMEQFISLAAHDLRSPMRKVSGLANLIRDEVSPASPELKELIGMLESVAGKSMALIADVIAHAQATGQTESAERFDLKELCESLMIVLDPAAEHCCVARSQGIYGDRVATQIILRNLLDNAIKHNPNRRLTLTVSAARLDERCYQVTLEDDGKGISDANRLFLDGGELKTDSGYGLAGVRRLVRSRGGDIAADVRPAATGARLRFSLPGTVLEEAA